MRFRECAPHPRPLPRRQAGLPQGEREFSFVMVQVRNLSKRFAIEGNLFKTKGYVQAVKDVSFKIDDDAIVALVGESGSGKSTVGKLIQGLLRPDGGSISFDGRPAETLHIKERAKEVQMIFQDPFSSLNPKLSVGTMLN